MSGIEEKPSEEISLNTVLKQMDESMYFEECNRDIYGEDETAFDIIASINGLIHQKLNIFRNNKGQQFIRTALGFKPLIVYNSEVENLRLRNTLAQHEKKITLDKQKNTELNTLLELGNNEIKIYKDRVEKLLNLLREERTEKNILKKENSNGLNLMPRRENRVNQDYQKKIENLSTEVQIEKNKRAVLENENSELKAYKGRFENLLVELKAERTKNAALTTKSLKSRNSEALSQKGRIEKLVNQLKDEKYNSSILKKENASLKFHYDNNIFAEKTRNNLIAGIDGLYTLLEQAIKNEASLSIGKRNVEKSELMLSNQKNTILRKAIYDTIIQATNLKAHINRLSR